LKLGFENKKKERKEKEKGYKNINNRYLKISPKLVLLIAQILSAFRTRGVPGPTSKLSPRAPAQMGRRETERERGKKPEGDMRKRGNPRPSCLSRAQVGCACSRGLQASAWERARGLCAPSRPSPARPTFCKRALDLPFIGVRRGSRCTMGGVTVC
jgi:hypothetical protein